MRPRIVPVEDISIGTDEQDQAICTDDLLRRQAQLQRLELRTIAGYRHRVLEGEGNVAEREVRERRAVAGDEVDDEGVREGDLLGELEGNGLDRAGPHAREVDHRRPEAGRGLVPWGGRVVGLDREVT